MQIPGLWVKKTSLIKTVATFKNCHFLNFFDENSKISLWYVKKLIDLIPNLILFQIFLFCLYIRKFVNSLLNYPQKISLQKFKPLFPSILRIFDLECHGNPRMTTSNKVVFVKFAHVFMKFRKLESLHMENKKLHRHKTEAATGGVL